jgi:hypothetical protein
MGQTKWTGQMGYARVAPELWLVVKFNDGVIELDLRRSISARLREAFSDLARTIGRALARRDHADEDK